MDSLGPDLAGYEKQVEEEMISDTIDYIFTHHGRVTSGTVLILAVVSNYLAPVGITDINSTLRTQGQYPLLDATILVIVLLFAAVALLILVHENIHRIFFRISGHNATVRYREMVTWADGQLVSRNRHIVGLLAPLAILTPVTYLAAVQAPGWELTILFSLLFVFNMFGSSLDVVNAYRALKHPKGTKYWTKDTEDGLIGIQYFPSKD